MKNYIAITLAAILMFGLGFGGMLYFGKNEEQSGMSVQINEDMSKNITEMADKAKTRQSGFEELQTTSVAYAATQESARASSGGGYYGGGSSGGSYSGGGSSGGGWWSGGEGDIEIDFNYQYGGNHCGDCGAVYYDDGVCPYCGNGTW